MKTIRRILTVAAVSAVALIVPSTAGAAVVLIQGGASGHGFATVWTANYDTVAKAITVDATYTQINGAQTNLLPAKDIIILTQPNGVQRAFGLGPTTATTIFDDDSVVSVDPLTAKSDGQPGILNKGPQTYSLPAGLRISANRAGLIDFETDFLP
jgi:hypothetical protein